MTKSLFLFGAILLPAAGLITTVHAQTDKPNVLMIVLDDLNDCIGVMKGHSQTKTPNMDRLAKEGILFTNAHTNCPVCSPSRASFMTGVLPTTSGCWGFKNPLQNLILNGCKTISAYARENGYKAYQTGKVLHHKVKGAWDQYGVPKSHGPYASDGRKMAQHPSCPEGMEHLGALDASFAPLSDIPSIPASKDAPGYTGWSNIRWGRKPTPFHYVSDDDRDKMVDELSVEWFQKKMKWLEKGKDREPFLIGFGIMRPHTPLIVPKKYFDMFPLDSIKLADIKENDRADCGSATLDGQKSRGQQTYHGLIKGYSDPNEGLRRYTQAYLASVAFADDIVGQALAVLENSRYRDNTIVILFSDHGYGLGEKEELWKYTNWEEATRVPFIIKAPRFAGNAGKIVRAPISLVDLFPTIKALCNLTGPTTKNANGVEPDGHSLVPLLENPDDGKWDGPEVAITVTSSWQSPAPRSQHLSARSRDFRYIRYFDGSEELYDHRRDHNEWKNLANNPEYDAVKAKMKKQLFALIPEKIKLGKAPASEEKKQSTEAANQAWKDKYFRKHPEADTNKDGKLSWPEYNVHRKTTKK